MAAKMHTFAEPGAHIGVFFLRLEKELPSDAHIPDFRIDSVKLALVNGRAVASPRHAAVAAYRAMRALREGKGLARTVEVEVVASLVGERQISRALKLVDPRGCDEVVAIVVSESEVDWNRAGERLCSRMGAELMTSFGSAEEALRLMGMVNTRSCSGNLEALVLEKSALLELER